MAQPSQPLQTSGIISMSDINGALGLTTSASSVTTVTATSIADLISKISTATINTIIVLANGTYTDNTFNINKDSITVKAETPGGVFLNGTNNINISGSNVKFSGFQFTSGVVTTNVITVTGNYAKLTYLNFNGYSAAKYINIKGKYTEVSYSNFENKPANAATGNLVHIDTQLDNMPSYVKIRYCSFQNIPGAGGDNGNECIRITNAEPRTYKSRALIEYCYFNNTGLGDSEAISVKSEENVIRFNTMVNNQKANFCFRNGDNNVAYGNFFINSGGIRIKQASNIHCYNNYFENCGDGNVSAPVKYFATAGFLNDLNFVHNTFVGGTQIELSVGGTNNSWANNIFKKTTGNIFSGSVTGNTFIGNIYNGSLGVTIASGVSNVDPQLIMNGDGYYGLSSNSAAINSAVSGYPTILDIVDIDDDPNILFDISGQVRGILKDVGCDEYTDVTSTRHPLVLTEVGPSYLGGPSEITTVSSSLLRSLRDNAYAAYVGSIPYNNRSMPKFSHWYGYYRAVAWRGINPTCIIVMEPTTPGTPYYTFTDAFSGDERYLSDTLIWEESTSVASTISYYEIDITKNGSYIKTLYTNTEDYLYYNPDTQWYPGSVQRVISFKHNSIARQYGTGNYILKVRAKDGLGQYSSYSANTSTYSWNSQTPSAHPTSLTATSITGTSFTLGWVASTYVGSGVIGYKIYKNGVYLSTVGVVTSSFITGLTAGTTYNFAVVAFTGSTTTSASSDILIVSTTSVDTTVPSATNAIVSFVSSTATTLNVSWSGFTDNVGISSYLVRVYLVSTNALVYTSTTLTSTTLSHNAYGLSANKQYRYDVIAYDAAGNSVTKSITITTPTDTTAPTTLSALSVGSRASDGFVVYWSTQPTDNVGVVGFYIKLNGLVIDYIANEIEYIFSGLNPSTSYTAGVAAYDAAGNVATYKYVSTTTTTTCLIEGTLITLYDGTQVPIETLQVNDSLLSLAIGGLPLYSDDETVLNTWSSSFINGSIGIANIVKIQPFLVDSVISINGLITSTSEHRHLIKTDNIWSFKKVIDVVIGDIMLDINNNEVIITSIETQNSSVTVYKLDVENLDIFYANGILTHNQKITAV